jgi:hypothetical protein
MVDLALRWSLTCGVIAALFLGVGGCATGRSPGDEVPPSGSPDNDDETSDDDASAGEQDEEDEGQDEEDEEEDNPDPEDSPDGSVEEDPDQPLGPDDPSWEAAGNSACGRVPVSGSTALIDDIEDGNDALPAMDNRIGYWFSYYDETDTTGSVSEPKPADEGADGTTRSMQVTGKSKVAALYGPGFGFNLRTVGATADALSCPYDASRYTGVTLWIRATGTTNVDLSVPTEATLTKAVGGTCSAMCDDHFFKSVAVSSTWKQVTVKFSELKQGGWGTATTFDAARITGLSFGVAPGATFDISVDEIAFTD